MQRFKSPGSAQRFLFIHAAVQNTFDTERHLMSRGTMVSFAAMQLDMASGNCNVKRVVRFRRSRRHLEVPVTVSIGLMPDVILENERGLLPGPDG
jgi:hypothetical protein